MKTKAPTSTNIKNFNKYVRGAIDQYDATDGPICGAPEQVRFTVLDRIKVRREQLLTLLLSICCFAAMAVLYLYHHSFGFVGHHDWQRAVLVWSYWCSR